MTENPGGSPENVVLPTFSLRPISSPEARAAEITAWRNQEAVWFPNSPYIQKQLFKSGTASAGNGSIRIPAERANGAQKSIGFKAPESKASFCAVTVRMGLFLSGVIRFKPVREHYANPSKEECDEGD